jgi:hypothetical protein
MTDCKLLAQGGPHGMIRAYCADCGFDALLELPASAGDFCSWIAAQEHAHKAFRDTRRDAARKAEDALVRAREADHDYAETTLDRDDNPIPPTCAYCGRGKAFCKGKKP